MFPSVPSEARKACADPGIERSAEATILRTRRALAICDVRRALAVQTADTMTDAFGAK